MPSETHRRFLNRFYRHGSALYDLTRPLFLFGRGAALRLLLAERWDSLIEVGPGTGQNLALLARSRPQARYGGLEPSDAMLAYARARLPQVELQRGWGEQLDAAALLGAAPDRVLFSYSLTMMEDPATALAAARAQLAPGGAVWVVDFGDHLGLPSPVGWLLDRWLRGFHVRPLSTELLAEGERLRSCCGGYGVIVRFGRPETEG
ncbi:MAG: class I SAM-dependent methyltransferase [Deltaproteobacteria bacterium]|nr:class I SAM-dependent methyltransferase [Deltaproteobacteria bacterium]